MVRNSVQRRLLVSMQRVIYDRRNLDFTYPRESELSLREEVCKLHLDKTFFDGHCELEVRCGDHTQGIYKVQ